MTARDTHVDATHASELERIAAARSEIRDWMLDPMNWHQLAGTYVRTYTDEGIHMLLDGATIHREDDAGGPVIVVSGTLSKMHGVDGTGEGYPFLLVREKDKCDEPEARHMLFLPTRPYHDGDEMDVSIEPYIPADVAGTPVMHGD